MKKTVLILICFVAVSLHAQKQNNMWYFGFWAALDFNGGAPVAITTNTLGSMEGTASVADRNTGALLFYTDSWYAINKNHTVMPNTYGTFNLLAGNLSSTQSSMILPNLTNPDKYYLFTTSAFGMGAGLSYSEVDMTLLGGLGDVTAVKNIPLQTPSSEKLTAVRHANGIDIWVISTSNLSNTFYAFLVTASGVSTTPVISTAGTTPVNASLYGIGQLKASPDGKLLAQALYNENKFDVLKFNKSTGTVTSWFTQNVPYCYGIEFSPDGTKLYTAQQHQWDDDIVQYDLSLSTPASILSSSLVIGTAMESSIPQSQTMNGSLQIAPDNKIYLAMYGAFHLSCIQNPNTAGMGCGFINHAVNLAGKKSSLGLPNMVPNLYLPNPKIVYLDTCAPSPTSFWIDSTRLSSVSWNFGNPASGGANTATTFTTSHTYTIDGTYSVTAIYTTPGGMIDTLTKVVSIIVPPVPSLGADLELCPLSQLTLSISSTYSSTWQNGSTDPVQVISTPGTYWVAASNACGFGSDTVLISPLEKPVSNISDSLVCEQDLPLHISVTTTPAAPQTYAWQDNSTGTDYTVPQPGHYWVDVTNSCGTIRDSIYIRTKPCGLSGPGELIIPNIITANNDNVNDVFKIAGLQNGDASLKIMNRWGIIIYENASYNNDWKPSGLTSGTYFYILQHLADHTIHKGFVSIFN